MLLLPRHHNGTDTASNAALNRSLPILRDRSVMTDPALPAQRKHNDPAPRAAAMTGPTQPASPTVGIRRGHQPRHPLLKSGTPASPALKPFPARGGRLPVHDYGGLTAGQRPAWRSTTRQLAQQSQDRSGRPQTPGPPAAGGHEPGADTVSATLHHIQIREPRRGARSAGTSGPLADPAAGRPQQHRGARMLGPVRRTHGVGQNPGTVPEAGTDRRDLGPGRSPDLPGPTALPVDACGTSSAWILT